MSFHILSMLLLDLTLTSLQGLAEALDSFPDLLSDFFEGLHPNLISGALGAELFEAPVQLLKQRDPARNHEISAQS